MINYLVLPVGQEVVFWITADNVPMSALFIPQLSSQIYAWPVCRHNCIYLQRKQGNYEEMNALYNGAGFSDMHFTVQVISMEEMNTWLKNQKNLSAILGSGLSSTIDSFSETTHRKPFLG